MQSFIDRRAVLSLKKRQTVSHNPPGAPEAAANAVASSGSSSKQDQLIFGTGSNNKSIT